jgi:two-component system chemotaxis sensor kinase CheA
MVPLKSLFQKMTRVARDASKKLNKKIKLTISGENTELDRVLMEKLADPLVHMIRNAVDHGIESSAKTRLAAGKSETGNIFLKAYYKGGSIIIELQDDGKGLDKDMIIQKAVEQGMYVNPEGMSDEEIYELIFAPGFSTAQSVSNMSGRGVGMDVVRRNISELRGRIEVISNLGQGTTFRMILPLTLAIIDGMVNKIGNGDFIIPTLSILETLNPAEVEMIKSGGAGSGRVFKLRNRLIPMMNIKQFYGIYDEYEGIRQPSIIVLQDMNRVAAIEVDQLVGQQQIVIKSLGKALGTVEGFSGAAIMSDGTVGMIIDVPTILRGVHSKIETLIKS